MKVIYETEPGRYRVELATELGRFGGRKFDTGRSEARFTNLENARDFADKLTEKTGLQARVVDTRPEKGERRMNADDIDLILTSGGCPEQYDATYNGETIGYLRLRHGHFTVEKDGPFGELLYEHSFSDSFKGMFDPDEREKFLNTAKQHLAHRLNKEGE